MSNIFGRITGRIDDRDNPRTSGAEEHIFRDPADVTPPDPPTPPVDPPQPQSETPTSGTPQAATPQPTGNPFIDMKDDPYIQEILAITDRVPTRYVACYHVLNNDSYWEIHDYMLELALHARMMVETFGGVMEAVTALESQGKIRKEIVYVGAAGYVLKDPLPDPDLAETLVDDLNERLEVAVEELESSDDAPSDPPPVPPTPEEATNTLLGVVDGMDQAAKDALLSELMKRLGATPPQPAPNPDPDPTEAGENPT